MKILIVFLMLTVMAFSQTYDVGQSNANVSLALENALAQPDSNTVYRNALLTKLNVSDSQLFIDSLWRSNDTIYFKQKDGSTLYFVDNNDGGSGESNPDSVTYAGRVMPVDSLVRKEDIVGDTSDYTVAQMDSILALAEQADNIYYDTLSYSWGIMDTVTTGDLPGWKVPNNITITEISAYTDANTVTFNLEERGETTPNTAGTDVMSSDLVADNDQQETGTFSNATIDRNDWLVPTVSATGDVAIFSITVRYVKTN